MYPRNAASPEPIAIGPVVQISDGAVQTAGVTVRIKPVGVSEADGGGTTAYSTDGVVLYTPTQGETNYTSFVLIAKKTGCIPATVTVVTSASATAGYAGVDWSKLTAATSTVNLSGTTISTSQVVASVTARVTANVDQWNGVTVTGMPMPTYTQPTGFLAATFPATVSSYAGGAVASVTGSVGSVTSPVTVGTNNDKTGYSLTQAFPTNFAALGINSSGHVSRVTLVDTTTTNTDMRGTDNAALASAWTSTRAGYLDSVLLAANANRTVQVTGSNHVAADIHELQPAVITDAAIATSAVTKLQSGLATLNNQTAIKTITDRLATMLVADGLVWQYTANALELAPGGGGGGSGDASQATLLEVQGTVEAIAASISGAAINVVSRVADGGSITLYAGDDMRVRSGTEVAVTISDVGGAIYTRLDSIGVAYLAFGAARPTQPAGAITGTIASLSQAGSGSSQTLTINIEIEDGGERLAPADNYVWQIVSSDAQGAEYDTYTEIEGTLTLKRRVAVPVYS